MRRAPAFLRQLRHSSGIRLGGQFSGTPSQLQSNPNIYVPSFLARFRSFSSDTDAPPPPSSSVDAKADAAQESSLAAPEDKQSAIVEDVGNKEFKALIEKYVHGKDEKVLPDIFEAVLRRQLSGKHQRSDDELMAEMRMRPLEDVKDAEFEEDFLDLYETDDDIENLYSTMPIVEKKMAANEYFNMDDRKWDALVKDAMEKGVIKDTSECEQILEDMLKWDKLLPDEIKQKIEAKFNELEDMCEKGEIEPEKAYEIFKEFEDKMVDECEQMMAAEDTKEAQMSGIDNKVQLEDPPGEGPVLRWQTRVVFAPGGDSWHPKNRKVKLSVTVKELGLSKPAARRLRELVGKRYNSGKDEVTITSERFEHREENRKDCLRTLYSLIEEAMKADRLVEDTRVAYIKSRLRANEPFMQRLRAKVAAMQQVPSAV